MLLTRLPRRLERLTGCVADGAHVEQILRRHLEARSATQLVDTPRLLLGVEFEVEVQHPPILNAAPEPLPRVTGHGHGEGKSQEALCHTTVAVQQGHVVSEHEVLTKVATRSGTLYFRQAHYLWLGVPRPVPYIGWDAGTQDLRCLPTTIRAPSSGV